MKMVIENLQFLVDVIVII